MFVVCNLDQIQLDETEHRIDKDKVKEDKELGDQFELECRNWKMEIGFLPGWS